MKELIKETFALWVRNLWVKEINKVMKKRDKALEEYQIHQYVVDEMYKEFCKLYPDAAEKWKEVKR